MDVNVRTKALVLQRKIADAHEACKKLYDELVKRQDLRNHNDIGDIEISLAKARRQIDYFVKQ